MCPPNISKEQAKTYMYICICVYQNIYNTILPINLQCKSYIQCMCITLPEHVQNKNLQIKNL